jgi:diguanylate cyclase (GGDEF)-like protein
MEDKEVSIAVAPHEDVRIRNYLITELTIVKFRWLVIAFFLWYFNFLHPAQWPIRLFNGILLAAAFYNLCIYLYIRRTRTFSAGLSLFFMYGDMVTVAAGMYFTGNAASPFLFIWYLTLFTAGIRFGYRRSLILQVPMALYYVFLLCRDPGLYDPRFLDRMVLGVFALSAVALYGSLFLREERFTFRVLERFHRRAIIDQLTGLYNYAYFMEELKREHAAAQRRGSQYSVILFDIDYFKRVNDTYGHENGNTVLKIVAGILKGDARRMDTVARYGGEEFVVLMPNTEGNELEVADRFRKRVEETEITGVVEGPIRVTISGGVCTYPHGAATVSDLLQRADQGLYVAKTSGRNRTCYFGGSDEKRVFDLAKY